jgi:hypothetical protein
MGFSDKIIFCAIIISIVVFVCHGQDLLSTSFVTQTVLNKETTSSCGKFCYENYLIFTDQETLQDSSNPFVGKLYNGDIYDKLEVGHTYNMTLIGLRIPTIGWYRNIIQFKDIDVN